MKTNKIFVEEVDWEDDEHKHGAVIFFSINDNKYEAIYEDPEDITSKWIEVEIGFWEKPGISLDEILKNNVNEEKKVIIPDKTPYNKRYHFYAQIISVNPLVLDCGELVLVSSQYHQGPITKVNSPEYIGKYIYYETIRLFVRKYNTVEGPDLG